MSHFRGVGGRGSKVCAQKDLNQSRVKKNDGLLDLRRPLPPGIRTDDMRGDKQVFNHLIAGCSSDTRHSL